MKPLSSNCYRFVAAVFGPGSGRASRLLTLAATLTLPLLLLAGAPASAQCPVGAGKVCLPVTKCMGLAHGNYQLTADITTLSTGDCIIIGEPNTLLDGNGHTITGPGGTSTGAGIHIKLRATGAIVEDSVFGDNRLEVFDFNVGLQDDASEATVLVLADNNNTAGVFLKGVKDGYFDVSNFGNGTNGVLLSSSSDNFVTGATFLNGTQGVLLQSSNDNVLFEVDSESNSAEGIKLQPGSSNQILESTADSNGNAGIAIAGGSSNLVFSNEASSNFAPDLVDLNFVPPCDLNRWLLNSFGFANQLCID